MKKTSRIRRSPEESRANILEAAERVLTEQGPQALRLVDVAKAAGVSNATVLHYYNSIEGVHSALMERMIEDLVAKILALELPEDVTRFRGFAFNALIETFEHKGAARLAAWMELTDQARRLKTVREAVSTVISKKIQHEDLPTEMTENVILLSVVMALGLGLFGESLEELLDKPRGTARQMAITLLTSGTEMIASKYEAEDQSD